MNAKLNFNGKAYELESFSVQHQKSGDPSSAKGKGSVEPLRPAIINATIKYKSFTEPPIDNLIKAAFNKSSATTYSGSIEVQADDDKDTSKIEFKKAQIFSLSELGHSGASAFIIELSIMAQEITHHGAGIKYEEGKSV